MKPGTKLKSAVCDTEVMIVRTDGTPIDCGGYPMSPERPAARAAIDPALADGTKIGKRYVNEAGTVELLCVKPGQGTLSNAGTVLKLKDAKPLPASD
jgi:hypothetical protein